MPELTESEAQEAFAVLRETLRSEHLEWVVQQVESAIALGKPRLRRLEKRDVREQLWPVVSPAVTNKGKGRPAQFVVAEEYSQLERLLLLAEAIRAAVVQPALFAQTVLAEIPEQNSGAGIAFRPELESEEGFVLDLPTVQMRAAVVALLARPLDELTGIEPDAASIVTTS